MTVAEILRLSQDAGVHLRAEEGRIIARPKGAVDDGLRQMIREHKDALLLALSLAESPANTPTHELTKPTEHPFVSFDSTAPAISAPETVVAPVNVVEPLPSPLDGFECSGCDHLDMQEEWHTGTRRRFWWRCRKGYELLEARRYGERVTISPPECDQFTPWKEGTK